MRDKSNHAFPDWPNLHQVTSVIARYSFSESVSGVLSFPIPDHPTTNNPRLNPRLLPIFLSPMLFLTNGFLSKLSDRFVPPSLFDGPRNRENTHQLLRARAVVTLTIITVVSLAYQFLLDGYFYTGFPVGLLTVGGLFLFSAILYCLPNEIISVKRAATIEVYYFLASSCIAVFFGNGFWKLSHANFFVLPPFSYVFVSKEFGKRITIFVSSIYLVAFVSSVGMQAPILAANQGAWVVLDCYVLSFIYWLFAAYEQEREYNEMMLHKSLDEARSAMSAKSMFISNVSHELRTPLHGILATVEILSKTKLTESQRALLNAIESCGTNLISVVNQVLTYAKMEHGKMSLENSTFDVLHLMQEIGDGMAPSTEKKGLELIVTTFMDSLHRFVIGDVGCIRQIVLNLLGNAIKFTDQGKIELTCFELNDLEGDSPQVSVKGKEKEDERIREGNEVFILIEVIDTGKGIAPEFMDRLYEPFSQEDSSLRRKFEGTGLGLSIAKGLLDLMHSKLEVQSQCNKGSRFSFRLRLPVVANMNVLQPSSYPFTHDILQLDKSIQEHLIDELRNRKICICASRDEFLLAARLEIYLKRWDIPFESFGRLLMEPEEKKRLTHAGCEILILNDSVEDLRVLLDAFPEFYSKDQLTNGNGYRQKVLFFSGISDYQSAEKLLTNYRPFSVVIVTKPAGPVKILEGLLKASHWLICSPQSSPGPINPSSSQSAEEARHKLLEAVFNHSYSGPDSKLWSPETYWSRREAFLEADAVVNVNDEKEKIEKEKDSIEKNDKQQEQVSDVVKQVEEAGVVEGGLVQDKLLEKKLRRKEDDVKFLIVEDNAINLMILTTFLNQHGFSNQESAQNGQQAVDKFKDKSFDIIFMDLQMPILDGIEATEQIRKIEAKRPESTSVPSDSPSSSKTTVERSHTKRAIIVAMTGLAGAEDREAAMNAGCDEFLTKPISLKQLEIRLQSWVGCVLSDPEPNLSAV